MENLSRLANVNKIAEDEQKVPAPLAAGGVRGQARNVDNLKVFIASARCESSRSTTCCSPARRDWQDHAGLHHRQ
jgi:hypothetical protein